MAIKTKPILFKSGYVHGNVDLNPRSRDNMGFEFGIYADSFRDSAHNLALVLEESPGYSDIDACPIAFLYRHALELYFKSIILIGSEVLSFAGKHHSNLYRIVNLNTHKNIFSVHSLKELFSFVDEIFNAIWGPWPTDDTIPNFDEVNKIIDELDSVDKSSFAFRYPRNKDGSICKIRDVKFNILDVSFILQPLCVFLENTYSGLYDLYEGYLEYLGNIMLEIYLFSLYPIA